MAETPESIVSKIVAKNDKKRQEVDFKIIEEENDFPMAKVQSVQIGSGHVVGQSTMDSSMLAFFEKLVAKARDLSGEGGDEVHAIIVEKN